MARLWKWVDSKDFTDEGKIRLFLFLNCLNYCAIGFLAWLIVSRFALDTWGWVFGFVGYPGFYAGFIGGCIFLYRK